MEESSEDPSSESRLVEQTSRTTLRRLPERGSYDREVIDAVLDEALVCHLGVAGEGGPMVLPTLFVRVGDEIMLHGSAANAILRSVRSGAPACVTVTILDGLVFARSAFHHSVNYRSVVVYGSPRLVTARRQKLAAFEALVEKVSPGRFGEARQPTEKEIKATIVIALPLTEASAKTRTGGPQDEPEDMALAVWAGVVPLWLEPGTPAADAGVELPVPATLLAGRWNGSAAAAGNGTAPAIGVDEVLALEEALLERDVARAEAEAYADVSRTLASISQRRVDELRGELDAVRAESEVGAAAVAEREAALSELRRQLAEESDERRRLLHEAEQSRTELEQQRQAREELEGSRAYCAITRYRVARAFVTHRVSGR